MMPVKLYTPGRLGAATLLTTENLTLAKWWLVLTALSR